MKKAIEINSTGISDSLHDGKIYARKNGDWLDITNMMSVATSDKRIKDDIIELSKDKMLEKARAINLYQYTKEGKLEVGVIAQEVEKVFPSVVVEHDGIKMVDYAKLGVILSLCNISQEG